MFDESESFSCCRHAEAMREEVYVLGAEEPSRSGFSPIMTFGFAIRSFKVNPAHTRKIEIKSLYPIELFFIHKE